MLQNVQKKQKKEILTRVWRVQHPNTGQNIQQWSAGPLEKPGSELL